MSVPGSATDPCDQTDMACKAAGGVAYAMCQNGAWPDRCQCVTPMMTSPITTQPPSTPPVTVAICGDNQITKPMESCDGQNLNNATCQTLGYNGGGTLLCNPTACTYDTIMCRMTVGTSSGAGMGGGAGSGAGRGG